jgi:hypothetical protein
MLIGLVGAGLAGGWARLRSDGDPPASAAGEDAAASGGAITSPSSVSTTNPAAVTTTAPAPPTSTSDTVEVWRVEVICKEAWEAAPIRGRLIEHQIERLTVHHTAVTMRDNAAAPRRLRSYQDYHQENGWPDIAYHYLIDAHGHVYEGRRVSARGDTFTDYDPTGHFLVCCDGDFDQQEVPAAQLASLADVLAWASVHFGVGSDAIGGHGDYAATSCPGTQLAGLIADGTLQSMVEQRIVAGGVLVSSLCGPAGFNRVAEIEAGSR